MVGRSKASSRMHVFVGRYFSRTLWCSFSQVFRPSPVYLIQSSLLPTWKCKYRVIGFLQSFIGCDRDVTETKSGQHCHHEDMIG